MPKDFLNRPQRSLLAALEKLGLVGSFHLAGGAGLAHYLRHRKTQALDFFTDAELDVQAILGALSKRYHVQVLRQAAHTLTLKANKVLVSFFVHAFPPVGKMMTSEAGIRIASMLDIAAMKLTAIAGRGSRKDFIDLYFVCRKGIALEEVLDTVAKRYRRVEYDSYHILRSLTYFDDAEKEAMPEMLIDVDWKQVKEFFRGEARRLFRGF